MEFLKANGFCSYLGLGKSSERPSSPSSSAAGTVPTIQAIAALGSRDRWRGPPDDDSHVETPVQGKAIRRIRMPRVTDWKKVDFSMKNSF